MYSRLETSLHSRSPDSAALSCGDIEVTCNPIRPSLTSSVCTTVDIVRELGERGFKEIGSGRVADAFIRCPGVRHGPSALLSGSDIRDPRSACRLVQALWLTNLGDRHAGDPSRDLSNHLAGWIDDAGRTETDSSVVPLAGDVGRHQPHARLVDTAYPDLVVAVLP
jgi:hypothetical protein